MGIPGLLPLLKSIMVPIHIEELKGSCVAIDTYSWLHKGALSCSTQLCKGLPTSRHIEYCMHRVHLLQHYGVKPVLVFDGGLLPMKIEQENKRARARKENLERAIEHDSNGNSSAAYECYQKAVDISPSIAHELIQVLKQENVSYVVAPYEADAQMTFLAVSKQVDVVITEDSDLIPFGCPRVIFKMDKYGQGVDFQYSRLRQNKDLSFVGFTKEMLLEMCILSGCDYLQSLPGMGLKRAHALITKFKKYDKVIKHLRYNTVAVPPLYEESFKKAILTFRHQRVFDPITEDVVHLSDISEILGNDLDFLGPLIPQLTAIGIAKGDLDPFTHMPFQSQGENVSSGLVLNVTPKFRGSKPESGKKKIDLPVQKNLLTKYFCFASLEAKRKFRAPRLSPASPSPSPVDDTSLSPKDCGHEEAGSCDINCSSAPSVLSKNEGNISLNHKVASYSPDGVLEFLESPSPGIMDEEGPPEHALLEKVGHSTHRPCQALPKECNNENIPSAAEVKSITENKRVIVRSRFFKHMSMKKNGEGNKQEMLSVEDDVSSDMYEDSDIESSDNARAENESVAARSSFCQYQSVNENDQDNKQERLLVRDDLANDRFEDFVLESPCSDNNYSSGIAMKRKTSLNDREQSGKMKPKHRHRDVSVPDNGCDPDLNEPPVETKTEDRKFGSDISHLNHYSNIAEKSVERFVSVISSFRYSSSGSRASGLRAPLKDIKNTSTNRSKNAVDLDQFAYIAKQKNAVDLDQFAYMPKKQKNAVDLNQFACIPKKQKTTVTFHRN